jgi:hypothetical protein
VSTRTFEVVVRGRLGASLLTAFDELWSTHCDRGMTHFVGSIPDQEELTRLFRLLRDLNIELVSVSTISDKS